MFGYGMNNAQQEQFAEQARQRRPIAYVLPHPEFEERHVGGINALDLSCYDDNSNDDSNDDHNHNHDSNRELLCYMPPA